MSGELFVDESKYRGFRLVGAHLPVSAVSRARRDLRHLLRPRQHRLHFRKENDGHRRAILAVFKTLPLTAHILVPTNPTDLTSARSACIRAAVGIARAQSLDRVTIELDEAAYLADRRDVYAAFAQHDERTHVTYNWLRAEQEPLLWVPDAVAWCWSKGGRWRSLVESSVETVVHQVEHC